MQKERYKTKRGDMNMAKLTKKWIENKPYKLEEITKRKDKSITKFLLEKLKGDKQ